MTARHVLDPSRLCQLLADEAAWMQDHGGNVLKPTHIIDHSAMDHSVSVEGLPCALPLPGRTILAGEAGTEEPGFLCLDWAHSADSFLRQTSATETS
eukprot:CAMPEP_0177436440 /NCGR_PEP_ID=MMETSP0369-20130122/1650_1 /TAXON_ID=447022 ORGANISM="Scrippsiella hangoei-like, Strain SHHI-4" /NCGR_SAMPLE_ID=MMETSP0369 /ASSEMBLY_ACC=CAM_ASM_000364 /LENGTH=96 /DNA_ID=CAMNT_0018907795 /DNA_START=41 /DNA_END=331 /DNA_ORIENTATION=-